MLIRDNILNVIKNRWYIHYRENANINNARFILIGNKSDLFGEKRKEIIREGEKFSEEIDALFMTCSAKSADNIDNSERYITTEAKRFIDTEEKENSLKADDPSIKSSNNNRNIFLLEDKDIQKCYCFTILKEIGRFYC